MLANVRKACRKKRFASFLHVRMTEKTMSIPEDVRQSQPLVLFDGVCSLCNHSVDFLLRHDRTGRLKFASLQGDMGGRVGEAFSHPTAQLDSIVVVESDRLYTHSTAALRLLPYLAWYWQVGRLGWLVPRVFRDWLYGIVARNRYRWFGQRDTCRMPTAETRTRLLP
jgi:predicted DCC family thiol-disulfide oxidoreductase YuxK